MKRPVFVMLAALVLITGAFAGAGEASAAGGPPNAGRGPVGVRGAPAPTTPLTAAEIAGLQRALDIEYKSWATYDQVISDFGRVVPFVGIRNAENGHISALKNLFRKYGLQIPANPWIGNVPHYSTVAEACIASAAHEQVQGPLYDELLATTSRVDIQRVYANLQAASVNRHQPAFQACATP